MILVKIKYRSPIKAEDIVRIALGLRVVVAAALSCQSELRSQDIDVEASEMTGRNMFFSGSVTRISGFDLYVEIETSDHPELRKNLDLRRYQILKGLRDILQSNPKHPKPLPDGFVLVKLIPASSDRI